MSFRRLGALGCAVALVGTLGACGVSAQSGPKTIARADVPFDLARRAQTMPPTTSTNGPYSYDLYFVSGERLRPVTRTAKSQPSATTTLRELLRGPDQSESEEGLRTVLAPDVSVQQVKVVHGLATVALDDTEASRISNDERALGIAQLVYTATAIPGVARVRFEVGGSSTEVPRGDGSLSSRPVTRADYPDVAP